MPSWFCIVLLVGTGVAADIPFVFDNNHSDVANFTSNQLEKASKSSPDLAGVPSIYEKSENATVDDISNIIETINQSPRNNSTISFIVLRNYIEVNKPLINNETSAHFKGTNYELPPEFLSNWFQKGNQNYDQGDYVNALECYDEAVQQNPLLSEAWYNKGNALYRLGRYKDALNAYQRAAGINPNLEEALRNEAIVLKKL
jgi:tetratricopeptide (TPR) repeat protein